MGTHVQTVTERLGNDHKRLLRIISLLDRELQNHQRQAWYSPTKVARILGALDYIQGFPQHWHHPVEELAFRQLLDNDAPQAQLIESLLDDHSILEAQTDDLFDRYEHCLNNKSAPDGALLKSTYHYLSRQMNHQKRENDTAFLLLDRFLSVDDWYEIEQKICAQPFNDRAKRHYLTVYDRIVRAPLSGLR